MTTTSTAQMTQMIGQMMWLPISMLACWMDLFAAVMRAAQPQGMQNFAAGYANAPGAGLPDGGSDRNNPWAQRIGAKTEGKEDRNMSSSSCCCSDRDQGMIKLIQYSIVSIKRCAEELLCQGEIIERTDMSDEALATWLVALYIQGDLKQCPPRKLDRDDKRYLRVYHRVLQEWPRQKDDCCDDNREVTALHEIRDAILDAIGGRKQEPAQA
jgi:hypothetical protein